MTTVDEDIKRRTDFYNKAEVAKYINKEGVPRTKRAVSAMMIAGGSTQDDSQPGSISYNCLNFVIFAVHPQQINIRDKANGAIIASIRR